MRRAVVVGSLCALGSFLVLLRADPPAAKKAVLVALVRHAEKASDGADPGLTAEGKKRAERLAEVFRRAKVDAIIASDLKRTQETLAPLAKLKKLEVKAIAEPADVVRAIKALAPGSVAVVAHHSYTLDSVLAGLGVGVAEITAVDLNEYDNLLIVAVHPSLEPRLVNLTY